MFEYELTDEPLVYTAWSHACYALDTPAVAFGPFAPFIELWAATRPAGAAASALPAWSDFSIDALEPYWGWLGLVELDDDPAVLYRTTLWGTALVAATGREMTGKSLGDFHPAGPLTEDHERAYMRMLVGAPAIGVWLSSFEPISGNEAVFSCIEVPLSASRTSTVSHVLTLYRDAARHPHPTIDAEPLLEERAAG